MVIDQTRFLPDHLGEPVDRIDIRQQSTVRTGPLVVRPRRRRLVHPGEVIRQPAAPISRQSSRRPAETIDDIVEIVHARIA